MKIRVGLFLSLFAFARAAQLSFDPAEADVKQDGEDEVLIGNAILSHRYLIRNNSLALPLQRGARAEQINETHYFGPAVTEPVEYTRSDSLYGFITFQTPDDGYVVIADGLGTLPADVVITQEAGGHCTGRESGATMAGIPKIALYGTAVIGYAVTLL